MKNSCTDISLPCRLSEISATTYLYLNQNMMIGY